MATTKINGHDVLIAVGETAGELNVVAASRDCSLNINSEMVEVASGTDGTVREYLAGRYDWTMNVEGLYTVGFNAGILAWFLMGTLLNVAFTVGEDTLTGKVYVESVDVNGPLRGKVTYNVALRGTGALTVVEPEEEEDEQSED